MNIRQQNEDFLSVLQDAPIENIRTFLRVLIKHIPSDRFGIVGGIAIRYWYALAGIAPPAREWNDIDISVKDLEDVPKSLAKDFLIYHYHLPKNKYFFVGFIHETLKIKGNIFPFYPSHQESFRAVPFESTTVYLVSPEEQLAL